MASLTRSSTPVDIELDILVRVLGLQVQQLCHHQTGSGRVDLLAQKDDAVIEQAGKKIVGPLPRT